MPFDSMAMAAIADEVAAAVGGRVQRILQPSIASIGLAIYADGEQRWLLLSADARYARVHFTAGKLAKGFATPSAFVMLLRKYLDGAKLTATHHRSYERVLALEFHGSEGAVRLTAEVMGKHSNIILVDASDKILGAIKIVPPRQSRVRPILPGRQYMPPPAQDRDERRFPPGQRTDPYRHGAEFKSVLQQGAAHETLQSALIGVLPGCGPFLAQQIAARAGVNPLTELHEADLERVVYAAGELYGLLQLRAWKPCMFRNESGRPDFAPYMPMAVDDPEPVDSLSMAIDRCLGQDESRDALSSTRTTVLSAIERARRAAAGRAASLREGLVATADAGSVMEQGQLILAYAYSIRPRADRLDIPDLDKSIPLNPRLTPSENAERAFRRYRKLRDAAVRIPGLLAEAESEESRLADLEVFARLADTEAALSDIQRDIAPASEEPARAGRKREAKRGPMRYRRDGVLAIVGRTAKENEGITFGTARREDTWLHARGRTGAHVVLQGAGPMSDNLLAAGAQLAAYFSAGRSDTYVDVDAAMVRDVRKIPGGPPGRVTYRNERTIRVQPSLEGWERL